MTRSHFKKKDYDLIAKTINDARHNLQYSFINKEEVKRSLNHVTQLLSLRLGNENPQFDKEKFYQMCGFEK